MENVKESLSTHLTNPLTSATLDNSKISLINQFQQ